MSDRQYLVLFFDELDNIEELDMAERGELLTMCYEYKQGKEVNTDNKAVRMAFNFIKSRFMREDTKNEEISNARRVAVNKRWEKQRQTENANTNNAQNPVVQNDTNEDFVATCISNKIQTDTKSIQVYTTDTNNNNNNNMNMYLNNGDAKASLVDAEGDDDSDPPDLPSENSPLDDLPDPDPEPEVKQKHKSKIPDPPYEVILALYKEILPELSQPSVLNAQRKGAINARWRELYSIAKTPEERLTCFRKVFENAKLNDWNFGNNERGWKANFDYFMQPKAFNQYLDCQAQPSGASNMSSIQKPWLVSGSALPTSYAQYKDWIAEGWNPATLNSSQFDKLQESGIIPSDGSFNKQNRRRA